MKSKAKANKKVNKEEAVGIIIPQTHKAPHDYLLQDIKAYQEIQGDIKKQIELSNKLYKFEGTISTAIDILVDFAITPIRVEPTGDKELDLILEHFNNSINEDNNNTLPGIDPLLQQVSLEFYLSGNVFPYEHWEDVDIEGVKAPVSIPTSIILLNPRSINIDEASLVFGKEVLYLTLESKLTSLLKQDGRSNPGIKMLKDLLSDNDRRKLQNLSQYSGKILINSRLVSHIKRKSRDYEAWGVPYLTKIFGIVAFIKKLRAVDEITAEGLINLMTVFKLGTDEHPASANRLKAFAQLLKNPATSLFLVWYHDLDVKTVGPEGKVLEMSGKYKEAYDELLRGLGVPPVLIDQTGSQDPYVALLSLAERLETFRTQIKIWLEKTYRKIAVENEKQDIFPRIRWSRTKLFNETQIKNLILAFHDRGLIGIETALEEAGYDFDIQLKRQKDEKSKGHKELFMPPKLPFSGINTPKDGRPTKLQQVPKSPQDQTKTKKEVNMQEQKKFKPVRPKAKASDNLAEHFYDRVLSIYDQLVSQTIIDLQEGISKEDIISRLDAFAVYIYTSSKAIAVVILEEHNDKIDEKCLQLSDLIFDKFQPIRDLINSSQINSDNILLEFNLRRTEIFNIIDDWYCNLGGN